MPATGPGERAVQLPWFWPDAESFVALSQFPTSLPWPTIQCDPGLLLFCLRRDLPFRDDGVVVGPEDCRAAAQLLEDPSVPWVDWRHPQLLPIARTALAACRFAELLAAHLGTVEPARAGAGAWLPFTGWLAVGVAEPQAVGNCLAELSPGVDARTTQLYYWGRTRGEIAWRLANTWPVPAWARVLLARLDMPPAEAERFGGDRELQAIVQTALVLAEQAETRLYLSEEFDLAAALGELHVRTADLDLLRERYSNAPGSWPERDCVDPRERADLRERFTRRNVVVADSTAQTDEVIDEFTALAERLQNAKLASLAEFAAGASHEINNPLAVISGQSQYLLKHETDEQRKRSLQSIVRQTRRIHSVLSELMLFARPPAPDTEWVELGRLIREAAGAIAPTAADKNVDIELTGVTTPLWVDVDPKQLTIALTALLRNGVEAATSGGWVRVQCFFRPDRLEIVVEDNGPGLAERDCTHLFDPFYSGREAGRGRGLGLSAAWRLAQQHGGEVRHVPLASGPTRFVLTLPGSAVVTASQRKSA